MSKRTKWLIGIGVIATVIFGLQVAAFAALPGSNFEITDGNLKVNGTAPPALDWANVTQTRKADAPPGSGDNSFVEGTKEDTEPPTVGTGGIPPEKSDLTEFGVYLETNAAGRFLNMYWTRVQEPNGTTNMDFEFNQASKLSANGVTPERTAGDVLIQYDLSQGGTNPTLWLSRWVATGNKSLCEANNSTPCWGKRVNLTTSGLATGSINTTAISSGESDGLGALSARTFGEAQVDFNALTGGAGSCTSFGSAYLKSRSSDQFNAALKDFIAPTNLNLPNCGGVTIRKQTLPDEDPNTTSFGYTKSITTNPVTPNTFSLTDDGVKTFTNVVQGANYTVTEDVIPAGWAFTSVDCSASTGVVVDTSAAPLIKFTIDAATDNVDCTYTNTKQKGALLIDKNSTKTGAAVKNAGAEFNYTGTSATDVTDNGTGDELTGAANIGKVCVSGLNTGDYTINETKAPTGYGSAPTPADNTATVAAGTNCTDKLPDATTGKVTFTNPPLADIQVNFRDGGSGETALEAAGIVCDNATGDTDETPATGWDASDTVTGINAGSTTVTVTCTIPIDP